MSIKALGINERLVKAVHELGFVNPTAIQEKAIPLLLHGDTDFIGLAQTGTGKTAAFGLPMLHRIDPSDKKTQALILAPTRELCLQISNELTRYAKYIDGLEVVSVYGGASITEQIRSLKKGAHVVVGTPGRLIDHLKRRTLSLQDIRVLILDEADQMLDMGFQEDIDTILSSANAGKNTWLFSATMEQRIAKIAQTYMRNPQEITVGSRNSGATNITHQYCVVKRSDVYEAIKRFIDFQPGMFGILFCRTRKQVQEITQDLTQEGYNVDGLHGDLSQGQRDVVMSKFRNKQLQLLVATDVAARGIDVGDVTHVLHYGLPDDVENYTHRSGRTARAGKSGYSIIICSGSDKSRIRFIERKIGKSIEHIQIPTGKQICEKQLLNFSEKVLNPALDAQIVKPYVAAIEQKLQALTKEELIERMVTLSCKKMLKKYAGTSDLKSESVSASSSRAEYSDRPERRMRTRKGNGNGSSASRLGSSSNKLFINIGKIDGLGTGGLINYICKNANVQGAEIGKIVLQDRHSWVGIDDNSKAMNIIRKLHGTSYKGRTLRVELAA
ncbi:MAG TPA: DEAD/DEAH box helicase [Candidatus Dependentiae bacterium]|nr:DEAD/DEAH box helicase [Candidatus Dependentiae bacterium]HRQ62504.1 DEAD/DEAH box helicase [Candidatus Dependentiae bacterium]